MTEKEEIISREELIGLVQLVIIFAAMLAGREIGNIYGSFNELSNMAVSLNTSEEAVAAYLRDTLEGENATLGVGLAITIRGYNNTEGPITQTPDYVRKWLISVTLSPIVVTQPEVSDVEMHLLIEGREVAAQTFQFPRAKVGYVAYLNRTVDLRVADVAALREIISAAAAEHGGEVEVRITGRAKANVLFLESMLPFTTTRYPIVSLPKLDIASTWDAPSPGGVYTANVGDSTPVLVTASNPTRVHSLTQQATCTIYMEGVAEPRFVQTKTITAAPGTVSTYLFLFTPTAPGNYFYTLETTGYSLPPESSPRLVVH